MVRPSVTAEALQRNIHAYCPTWGAQTLAGSFAKPARPANSNPRATPEGPQWRVFSGCSRFQQVPA
eukprot:15475951-Alexandrium_andersonii.AAC.1